MRYALIALSLLFGTATPAAAGVGVSISGVSIGIHVPAYPVLVPVPGYPVYYAPQVHANYFFYDGYYWLYHDDSWYVSDWYNGPWDRVGPDDVPLFVLRVPVRYYPAPPLFFHGWYLDAPPLWHVHWGHRWTRHYHGWERWDPRVVYAPAPLPYYQRHYAGAHYPRGEHRRLIRREHYRYRPHDIAVRRHDQQRAPQPARREHETFSSQPRQQVAPRYNSPAVSQQRLQSRQETERRSQAFSQPQPRTQPRTQPQRQPRPQVAAAVRPRGEAMQRPPAMDGLRSHVHTAAGALNGNDYDRGRLRQRHAGHERAGKRH
ncbi:MAG: hypothetical protein AB7E73_01605 [Burkholderiales bacterium]